MDGNLTIVKLTFKHAYILSLVASGVPECSFVVRNIGTSFSKIAKMLNNFIIKNTFIRSMYLFICYHLISAYMFIYKFLICLYPVECTVGDDCGFGTELIVTK